jgi:hypothetical protein
MTGLVDRQLAELERLQREVQQQLARLDGTPTSANGSDDESTTELLKPLDRADAAAWQAALEEHQRTLVASSTRWPRP